MFKTLSKVISVALATVMTCGTTAFGAESTPVSGEVVNPTFVTVNTIPQKTPEQPTTVSGDNTQTQTETTESTETTEKTESTETTQTTQTTETTETVEKKGRKLVPKELESKAQPTLFTKAPEPKPVLVEKAKEFDFDIASYTTKYSGADSLNRNYNMRLASDSINGMILQPGQTFSYNDVILSKSNNGKMYKTAGIYVNGEVSTGIGGGICQISSTLYQAALYSGMEITKRQNHSLKVGYMPAGRDATASWGSIDFKFKNPLDIPVKIESVMKNGVIKIRFLAQQDPKIGDITVNVTQKDGVYTLTRTRADGTVDHTSRSKYKN